MQDAKAYKTFFTVAALWNFSAALLFIFMGMFNHTLLGYFLKIIPENFIWFYSFLALVTGYGMGYYWAGQDVHKNRDIIKMGVFGKSMVFILFLKACLAGAITIFALGAGIVDLIFTVLFINVLIKTKK